MLLKSENNLGDSCVSGSRPPCVNRMKMLTTDVKNEAGMRKRHRDIFSVEQGSKA